ncbi:ABC-type sugar transport system, periplasmic component [uncultured Pleomorphomonas sp.]|uniref:ABC-type sugar transport system, periplasmic component n=1 Tax=uncultured Pleomorphomonas sp. TaxID=442121 RepID=A0A212LH38_9HYPH|nr:LacI family DNA-binding transcriptional regulator [uncultured Pleomorphomonas sp.]SCM76872.1 ABC-type sugar transport system, periplasmic component [uncultured Pleomorphomonas sp.]
MNVRPTIADLALAANVSVSTVDRVLSGRHAVRKATAQQVLAAAERIGFYATGTIRHRLKQDRPARTFGFLLQQPRRTFYQILGKALKEATEASEAVQGRAIVEYRDDLSPEEVSENLLRLSRDADAIAVVTADHPKVTGAIDRLRSDGVPVVAVISELTAPAVAGYVGLDNWKVGGTAAWMISRLCRTPGKVGVYVGNHRYLCQDVCEIRFRAYFRENAPEFELLESRTTFEDPRFAYEMTLDLIQRTPDLVGLYVAGGGISGVMRALAEEGGEVAKRLVVVGRELTPETRSGLVDGTVDVILSHPQKMLAETTVNTLIEVTANKNRTDPLQRILPFDIYTNENV